MNPIKRKILIFCWIACLVITFSLLIPHPVYADDCLTDPLNAADCMRTPGFRPTIAIIISVGSTLVTILVSVLSGTASVAGAAGAGVAGAASGAAGIGGIPGNILNDPQLNGGPADNNFTNFNGGDGPGCGSAFGLPNYWVNTANLNLYIQDMVYAYQGLGPRIELKFSYNSAPGNTGMFGKNWRFFYDSSIQQLSDRYLLWKGSGQRLAFQKAGNPAGQNPNSPLAAVSLDGSRDKLFDYGAYFQLFENDSRLIFRYDKDPGGVGARLSAIMDQNNNVVKLAYDSMAHLVSLTDAAGRHITFSYDANQHCVGFSLPDGRQTKYGYDGQGNLVQAIDLLGTIVLYEYDNKSNLTRMMVGRDQKTTTFIYQDKGQVQYLAGVTDAGGNTTSYELVSETPRHVRVTDPEGKPTSYYSTPQGYTGRVVDPLGNAVTNNFVNGLPTSFVNANKQSSRIEYDLSGNPIRRIDPLGAIWTTAYDNNNRLVSETDPEGATWQYGYDTRGNLIQTISSQGRTFTWEYDDKGLLTAFINAGGHKTTFAYDEFGNKIAVTHPLRNITKYAYDHYGFNRIATTDSNGNTTRYEYDANQRLTRITHPDGTSRKYEYDCCAGAAVIDENDNKVLTKRDPLLQIMEKNDTLGNVNTYFYDRNKRQVKVQDPIGNTWEVAYDPASRLVQWTNSIGSTGRMAYDAEGNLTSLMDERGNKTSFVFDANDQLIGITDPLGSNQHLTYDKNGRLCEFTNARGGTIKIVYDAAGRVTEKSFDGKKVAAFAYDELGNLTHMTDDGGKTDYSFNIDKKVTSIRFPDQLMVSYSYDPNGNISTITYPGNQVVRYVYDTLNRITQMVCGQYSTSYRYDAVGNIIEISRSNAVQSAYEYDANNRLIKMTHKAGSDVFAELTYSRDQVGNINSESGVLPLKSNYHEDSLPTTYNDLNQIVSRGEEAYTYDKDGNLVRIGMDGWQARYDQENRPVEISQNGKLSKMTYNGMGYRTLVDSGVGQHIYHHDPQGKLLFETDQSGNLIASYLYRNSCLVARMDAFGDLHFYHFDKTGNTLALSDKSGEVVAAYTYAPYGAVTNKFGDLDNPFTYVGEYGVMDDGDGLFFMRNRTYDALTGRFIQKDPLGFVEGTNLYAYVSNNPIGHIDPLGLTWYWPPSWFGPGPQAGIEIFTGLAADLIGGALLLSNPATGVPILAVGLVLTVKGIYTWKSSGQAQNAIKVVDKINMPGLVQDPVTHQWTVDPEITAGLPDHRVKSMQGTANKLNANHSCPAHPQH